MSRLRPVPSILSSSDCDLSADSLQTSAQLYLQSSYIFLTRQLLIDPSAVLNTSRLELVQLELEMAAPEGQTVGH